MCVSYSLLAITACHSIKPCDVLELCHLLFMSILGTELSPSIYKLYSLNDNYCTAVIVMRVSPGYNVSRTHTTRDACFPSVIHVSPAHISLGMRVSWIAVQHI